MFTWAVLFFVIAVVAAIFGYGTASEAASGAAKIICVVALALALIGFIFRSPPDPPPPPNKP